MFRGNEPSFPIAGAGIAQRLAEARFAAKIPERSARMIFTVIRLRRTRPCRRPKPRSYIRPRNRKRRGGRENHRFTFFNKSEREDKWYYNIYRGSFMLLIYIIISVIDRLEFYLTNDFCRLSEIRIDIDRNKLRYKYSFRPIFVGITNIMTIFVI